MAKPSVNLRYRTKRFVGDANRSPELMMAQFLNANNIQPEHIVNVSVTTVDTKHMVDRIPTNDIVIILLYVLDELEIQCATLVVKILRNENLTTDELGIVNHILQFNRYNWFISGVNMLIAPIPNPLRVV